ncbi:EbsA family protein [Flavobacterium procerum]|uniref:EbsA family protein n=1 Tax=Flavobacterium procerum TaxID=1455569 RepID=A0ABV6BY21_9FLAO
MQDDIKIIANPSLFQVAIGLIAILFSGSFVFMIYAGGGLNGNDDTIILASKIMISLFCCFALLGLYLLLVTKKIILTNDQLIIRYPLLFKTKEIDIEEIKKVRIEKYNIKHSRNFSENEIYTGTKIVIEFFELKKIAITSLEVSNYKNLAHNLKNSTNSYFRIRAYEGNKNYGETKFIAYTWLVFCLLLTFGLIIALINKNMQPT